PTHEVFLAKHGIGNSTLRRKTLTVEGSFFVAAGPVSRILCAAPDLRGPATANRRRQRAARRSFLWAAHYCAALATYPEVVTHRAGTCAAEANAPPLFGLAPCGVFPATAIAGGAVRSYRTFSPLPRRSGAVYFLWHSPSTPLDRRRPDVIRHTALWSSDFPLSARATGSAKAEQQLTGWQRPSGPAANTAIIDARRPPALQTPTPAGA